MMRTLGMYRTFKEQQLPNIPAYQNEENGGKQKPAKGGEANYNDRENICIGAFILRTEVAPFDISEAELRRGDEYLGLHMRPLEPNEAKLDYVRPSLRAVANLFRDEEVSRELPVGAITYRRFGRAAARLGFTVIEPEALQTGQDLDPLTEPVLAFTTVGQLIEKYESETPTTISLPEQTGRIKELVSPS